MVPERSLGSLEASRGFSGSSWPQRAPTRRGFCHLFSHLPPPTPGAGEDSGRPARRGQAARGVCAAGPLARARARRLRRQASAVADHARREELGPVRGAARSGLWLWALAAPSAALTSRGAEAAALAGASCGASCNCFMALPSRVYNSTKRGLLACLLCGEMARFASGHPYRTMHLRRRTLQASSPQRCAAHRGGDL